MTTDEIKLALRLVAMGRVNHPQVDELAEALSRVLTKNACDVCTMPGGKHYVHCPHNPESPENVALPNAGVYEFDVREIAAKVPLSQLATRSDLKAKEARIDAMEAAMREMAEPAAPKRRKKAD